MDGSMIAGVCQRSDLAEDALFLLLRMKCTVEYGKR